MENSILNQFLFKHKLKFSEIEKALKIRSNKLAYHIKNLVKKKILEKHGETYSLSETAETLIPYLYEKKSPLPVILVAITKTRDKIFLHKRSKRPFKNKLSLPGGRILQGESIKEAAERIMKNKHNINCKFKNTNSVSIEHIIRQDKKLHSFVLILVTATTEDKIEYTSLSKNSQNIITSDYNLVKNNLKEKVIINEFLTKD